MTCSRPAELPHQGSSCLLCLVWAAAASSSDLFVSTLYHVRSTVHVVSQIQKARAQYSCVYFTRLSIEKAAFLAQRIRSYSRPLRYAYKYGAIRNQGLRSQIAVYIHAHMPNLSNWNPNIKYKKRLQRRPWQPVVS